MTNVMVKEMSMQDMQDVNGGFWWAPFCFVGALALEYYYDPEQAMADYEKGYNRTRGK